MSALAYAETSGENVEIFNEIRGIGDESAGNLACFHLIIEVFLVIV
jgi:hypothetical protein